MSTFNQRGQKVIGNQYNIGGNATFGEVPVALQNLILEIEKSKESGSISVETATSVEKCVKDAIVETTKPEPNSKAIIDKLNSAKAMIEGLASAGGLVKIFFEAADMVRRLLP